MDIDYNNEENSIIYQIVHSNDNLDINNDKDLFEYYEKLIRYRHDLLHYSVLKMMGLKWESEKSFNNYFDLNDENDLLRKTPDIIYKFELKYYIIDVSVSIDTHAQFKNKNDKYQPVVLYLKNKYSILSEFIHINVNQTLSNIEREIYKLDFLKKEEFNYQFMNSCLELIDIKKDWVSNYIDKDYFNNMKLKYYGDDFKYEDIGQYKDVDINIDEFKKFNSKFEHISKFENNIDKFDEKEFVDNMRIELDNPHSKLIGKYLDNKLDSKQFIDAKKIIEKDIMNRKIITPKPTHHVIVPLYEDFPFLKDDSEKFKEQNMLKNLFNYLLNNIKEEDSQTTFIYQIIKNYIRLLTKSPDCEINNEINNTGTLYKNEKDLKTKFNEEKYFCEIFLKTDPKKDNNNIYKKISKKCKKLYGLKKIRI